MSTFLGLFLNNVVANILFPAITCLCSPGLMITHIGIISYPTIGTIKYNEYIVLKNINHYQRGVIFEGGKVCGVEKSLGATAALQVASVSN